MWPAVASALGAAAPQVASAQPAPQQVSVQDAMNAAVRASLPLAAARATRERAHADVTVARSGWWPQINVSASYVDTLRSEYSDLFSASDSAMAAMGMSQLGGLSQLPFAATHAWRAGVDVNQSIWDGGRTSSSVAGARGSERAAELDERARRAQAVLEVTDAYFGAELAAEVAAIAEASLSLAEQTLEQTKLGLSQGTVPEFDVVRSEVTRDNQRTQLVRARSARDVALVRLRKQLGIPLDRAVELTTKLAGEDFGDLARTIAGVPSGAERVSVASARAIVDIRRAQVGVAQSNRWPRIGAFTSYGVVDYPFDVWPDSDWRTNWTVGATLAFPLFTGFRTSAQIAGARADVRAAEALAAEAAQLAAVDDRERTADLAVDAAAYAASHRSTELARRAHEIAQVRFRQGVSTYLELVDARIQLDQAQINEATAARDLQLARVRIALLPALPVAAPGAVPSAAAAGAVTPPSAAGQTAAPPPAQTTAPAAGAPGSPATPGAPGGAPPTTTPTPQGPQ
ncbi:MAG TPA: TolC family protein [Kofleriaceae bacterium]|nr:TolC family protein [Kofleriaceae bacterium]